MKNNYKFNFYYSDRENNGAERHWDNQSNILIQAITDSNLKIFKAIYDVHPKLNDICCTITKIVDTGPYIDDLEYIYDQDITGFDYSYFELIDECK